MSAAYRRTRLLLSCLAVLALTLAACGGETSVGEEPEAGPADADGEVTPTEDAAARADLEDTGEDAEDAGEPVELVLAVETNPGDPLADFLNFFGDALETDLGDQVTVERFLGGAMGDEEASLEALRAGEIDVVPVGSDITSLDPIFGIMELPFLFSDRQQVTAFLDGEFGDEMSESLEATQGLHVLAFGENGFRNVTNNVRPVMVPEDLSGLKLRVPGVDARVTAFERLGAVPTPLSIDEVYIALDQGVVDGQENPLSVIQAFSFFEVQDYLSLTRHVYTPATLVINAERWGELSPDVQEAVQAAADTAAQQSRDLGAENDDTLLAGFEEAGMEINEIDTEAFAEGVRPIWEDLKGPVGADFVDRALAELGY